MHSRHSKKKKKKIDQSILGLYWANFELASSLLFDPRMGNNRTKKEKTTKFNMKENQGWDWTSWDCSNRE